MTTWWNEVSLSTTEEECIEEHYTPKEQEPALMSNWELETTLSPLLGWKRRLKFYLRFKIYYYPKMEIWSRNKGEIIKRRTPPLTTDPKFIPEMLEKLFQLIGPFRITYKEQKSFQRNLAEILLITIWESDAI